MLAGIHRATEVIERKLTSNNQKISVSSAAGIPGWQVLGVQRNNTGNY